MAENASVQESTEKVADAAAQLSELGVDSVEKVVALVETQAPLLCEDILLAEMLAYGLWFGILMLITVALLSTAGYVRRIPAKCKDMDTGDIVTCQSFGYVVLPLVSLVAMVIAATCLYQILLVIYAPRFVLFEYFNKIL